MRDITKELVVAEAVSYGDHTDVPQFGATADVSDCNAVAFFATCDAIDATGGEITLTVEQSEDGTTWDIDETAVVGGGLLVANTDLSVGYNGVKRYVRAVTTVVGSPATSVYSVTTVKGHLRLSPEIA